MERPIIFTSEEVRAIIEGRKTMMRRAVRFKGAALAADIKADTVAGFEERDDAWHGKLKSWNVYVPLGQCPFGNPGDHLWVKETHGFGWWGGEFYSAIKNTAKAEKPDKVFYKADGWDESQGRHCWRPSNSMPRWASRIALEITGVRVEQLQAVTPGDVVSEGTPLPSPRIGHDVDIDGFYDNGFLLRAFATDWNLRNAKRGFGWDTNPWVWVVSFKNV